MMLMWHRGTKARQLGNGVEQAEVWGGGNGKVGQGWGRDGGPHYEPVSGAPAYGYL